jgi:hypothetical protein
MQLRRLDGKMMQLMLHMAYLLQNLYNLILFRLWQGK